MIEEFMRRWFTVVKILAHIRYDVLKAEIMRYAWWDVWWWVVYIGKGLSGVWGLGERFWPLGGSLRLAVLRVGRVVEFCSLVGGLRGTWGWFVGVLRCGVGGFVPLARVVDGGVVRLFFRRRYLGLGELREPFGLFGGGGALRGEGRFEIGTRSLACGPELWWRGWVGGGARVGAPFGWWSGVIGLVLNSCGGGRWWDFGTGFRVGLNGEWGCGWCLWSWWHIMARLPADVVVVVVEVGCLCGVGGRGVLYRSNSGWLEFFG
ncbi:hypothetical protein Tco_0588742 [Tanacetum coccineum]